MMLRSTNYYSIDQSFDRSINRKTTTTAFIIVIFIWPFLSIFLPACLFIIVRHFPATTTVAFRKKKRIEIIIIIIITTTTTTTNFIIIIATTTIMFFMLFNYFVILRSKLFVRRTKSRSFFFLTFLVKNTILIAVCFACPQTSLILIKGNF